MQNWGQSSRRYKRTYTVSWSTTHRWWQSAPSGAQGTCESCNWQYWPPFRENKCRWIWRKSGCTRTKRRNWAYYFSGGPYQDRRIYSWSWRETRLSVVALDRVPLPLLDGRATGERRDNSHMGSDKRTPQSQTSPQCAQGCARGSKDVVKTTRWVSSGFFVKD